jgi:hypothetical protein
VKLIGALIAIAVVSAWLREHFPAELLALLGESAPAVLAVVVVVGLLTWAGRSRAKAGVFRIGHSHGGGSSRFIGRHEGGHVVVARKVGFGGVSAWANHHEGVTSSTSAPDDPVAHIAVARAGRYAVGSGAGCGWDDAQVRRILRGVPREQRAQIRRDGEELARRTVRANRGAIRRVGRRIEQTGRS